jgi:hypothetical protein
MLIQECVGHHKKYVPPIQEDSDDDIPHFLYQDFQVVPIALLTA